MQNKFSLLILLLSFPFINIFGGRYDYGRPWDDPDYHRSGFSDIVIIPIAIIVLIIAVIIWIYFNKEVIGNIVKYGFYLLCGGAALFGFVVLPILDRVSRSSENSPDPLPSVNSNSTYNNLNSSQSIPIINNEKYLTPSEEPYQPTLKFRTVEYLENCFKCNGKGKIICQKCNGSGWISKKCTQCNGKGSWKASCTYCLCNGYNDNYFTGGKNECFYCNGTGKASHNCYLCQGTGTQTEICDIYASAQLETHYQTCSNCNGSGSIKRTHQESYYD